MDVLSVQWLGIMAALAAVFWATPEPWRRYVPALATAAITTWLSPLTLAALVLAVGVCWLAQSRLAENGRLIALACAVQLLPLVVWRINAQMPLPGLAGIAIPLGLSYIGLRGVHYCIESYKDSLPHHTLADLVGYFLFLPTLIAGPVHRFAAYVGDEHRRRWNPALFSEGLERILYGYVKIAFLANLLVETTLTGWITAQIVPGSQAALYGTMIAKGLNGYLQFAGYSDVAIGFARLLGFRVMENFDSPLIKPNVQAFWGAWHMSLTTWCRDYVYTPVFSLTRARNLGIIASMAVLGLWHEFTARYLLWGLYNGLAIVAWHHWRSLTGERLEGWLANHRALAMAWRVFAVLLTIHVIFVGFILVQHKSLADALTFFTAMIGLA